MPGLVLRLRLIGLRVAARSWINVALSMTGDATAGAGDRGRAGGGEPASTARLDPQDLVAAAYESFQREIHSFVLHATHDPEVAADVTHEAFLKLLREAQASRTPDNIRAWLYRVATNLVLNRARHERIADGVRRLWTGGEEAEVSPEWLTLRAEQAAVLRAALAVLPRDARVGLLLAANGFSGREIAAHLGRTELATRTLLCRARAELRERLTPALAIEPAT